MAKTKYIKNPEQMWEYFQGYVRDTKNNPRKLNDYVGKDATEVWIEKERPLTMEGFLNHLDTQGIITDATDYFENKENRYDKYVRICTRIRRLIRQDQIEGGRTGSYNPSITQRLNGLTEKIQEDGTKEITIKVKHERKGTDSNAE